MTGPDIRSVLSGTAGLSVLVALALLLNGVAHPLMALREGAYFPGLYSSPLVGLLGILLLGGLRKLTHAEEPWA